MVMKLLIGLELICPSESGLIEDYASAEKSTIYFVSICNKWRYNDWLSFGLDFIRKIFFVIKYAFELCNGRTFFTKIMNCVVTANCFDWVMKTRKECGFVASSHLVMFQDFKINADREYVARNRLHCSSIN